MDDDEWPPPGHSILPENVSRTLALDSGADAETALTIVRAWLDSGGELEAIEDNGDTALIKASYANRAEVVELLLARGANVHAKSLDDEYTSLHCAVCPDIGLSPPDAERRARAVSLLLSAGADVHTEATGRAVIDVFFSQGCEHAILVQLLRAGASIDLPNDPVSLMRTRLANITTRHPSLVASSGNDMFRTVSGLSECSTLVSAVRDAGGWRDYVLTPRRALLRLRSLRARGRAQPTAATPEQVKRLLDPNLPNELLGTIFAYWKESP